jgi:hypothetical protein
MHDDPGRDPLGGAAGLERRNHPTQVWGTGYERVGAHLDRQVAVLLLDVGRGGEHDRQVGQPRILAHGTAQPIPVELRHQDVADDGVRRIVARARERVLPVRGRLHGITRFRESADRQLALDRLVVGDEDASPRPAEPASRAVGRWARIASSSSEGATGLARNS